VRVRLSSQARQDLILIREYIASDNPRAAARIIRSIRQTLEEIIARYPLVGISRDDLSPGLRCFPVGNYLIFYEVAECVDVVRVLHSARDIPSRFFD
jgi:toxin ParE1/3/4